MNLKKLTIFILSILLLIISLYFGFYFYHSSQQQSQSNQFKTIKVKHKLLLSTIGTQEAVKSFNIYYNDQLGYINQFLVKNQSSIKKDTPLFEYFNPSKQKQLEQQQHLTLSQIQKAFPKLSIQQQQQQLLERTLMTSQFVKDKSETRTTIYSPTSGKVHLFTQSPSKSNNKIMQINSHERIIRANISESEKDKLRINQDISIYSNDKKSFIGKIKYISDIPQQIKSNQSTYQIEISTQQHFAIGTHFKIKLFSNDILVPKTALIDNKYVLVQLGHRLVKRQVTYQLTDQKNMINVTQGLMLNEKVVEAPSKSLQSSYK